MPKMKLFAKGKKPLIMAHRGTKNFPENSKEAFKEAVSMNVDVIETDVHITRDEEIVIFHDETVDRITNGKGKISNLNLEELKLLDIGYFFKDEKGNYSFRGKNFHILTLDELFTTFPDTQVNLDIKTPDKRAIELVGNKIRQYGRETNIIVGSFHQEIIDLLRDKYPTVYTAAGPNDVKKFILRHSIKLNWTMRNFKYQCFQIPVFHGNRRIITKKFVNWAHKKELAVHAWTINDETTMRELIELKIDGIFTDKPSLLSEISEEYSRKS